MTTATITRKNANCAIRIKDQLAGLAEIVHEFYSPLGWYLGMVTKEGQLLRFSELFPSQDSARHVLDLLIESGITPEDFVSIEEAHEQYCDFGVTSFARVAPTHYAAVGLTLTARVRLLHLERQRLTTDLELPIIRTVFRFVQWCRSMMVWNHSRSVVVGTLG